MKRALAPSFVVTTYALSTLACHDPPTHANPPGPTDSVDASSTAATQPIASATPAKRKRSTPAPARTASSNLDSWDWSSSESLNPKDAQGRVIFTASNDACYVEVPMSPPPDFSKMPTGSRAVDSRFLDCPAMMNDPAWDTCSDSLLLRSKASGECACSPTYGNPPPPPSKNVCPSTTK
jgi:hypothetical protein